MVRYRLCLRGCLIGSCLLLSLAVRAEPPGPAPGKALLQVRTPDPYAVLYVNGKKTESRGELIWLETPMLDSGKTNVYQLRVAFRSQDRLLIQDRTVEVQAGRTTTVTFDGKNALSVPLPQANPVPGSAPGGHELLPYPRPATDKDSK
jgi:uncharacterized protein (TIGR03000 family)